MEKIVTHLYFATAGPSGLVGIAQNRLETFGDSKRYAETKPELGELFCTYQQDDESDPVKYFLWNWECRTLPNGTLEEKFLLIPDEAWHVYPMQ